jgi:hypothetical protein
MLDYTYFKNLVDKQFHEAISEIENHLNMVNNSDNNENWQSIIDKVNQFIIWALNEYQNDGIDLYSFAKECFWSDNPISFLSGLSSFVGNCVYDDSYFVIEYRDYSDEWYKSKDLHYKMKINDKSTIRKVNGIFNYDKKLMYYWEPVLLWVGDENENATQNVDYLLSAIIFIENQRNEMIK